MWRHACCLTWESETPFHGCQCYIEIRCTGRLNCSQERVHHNEPSCLGKFLHPFRMPGKARHSTAIHIFILFFRLIKFSSKIKLVASVMTSKSTKNHILNDWEVILFCEWFIHTITVEKHKKLENNLNDFQTFANWNNIPFPEKKTAIDLPFSHQSNYWIRW